MPPHPTAPNSAGSDPVDPALATKQTERWLERLVIGLQLCPFAANPYRAGTVRFRVSEANQPEQLCSDLLDELQRLVSEPRESLETTLLIHPSTLRTFSDFNDFLDVADACLRSLDLAGVVQIASFHPDYQFAGSQPDDVANATNRSPHPTLHLLREESIRDALDHFEGDPGQIPQRNIELLTQLGWQGIAARAAIDESKGSDPSKGSGESTGSKGVGTT